MAMVREILEIKSSKPAKAGKHLQKLYVTTTSKGTVDSFLSWDCMKKKNTDVCICNPESTIVQQFKYIMCAAKEVN